MEKQEIAKGDIDFEVIKDVEVANLEGFFPDSRAYFIYEIVDEDEIFIHGGGNKKKDYDQIDIFDARNLKWKPIAEISTVNPFFVFDKPLAGHTSNLVNIDKNNRSLIVYGGFDGKTYSNSVYVVETDDYQFTQVDIRAEKGSEYPLARCYHTSNYDEENSCLYIFGGWNGNISALFSSNFYSLWKFNFKSKRLLIIILVHTWEKIPLFLSLSKKQAPSNISLRGHSTHFLMKNNESHLLVYGGVTGFNKYNENIYYINVQVLNSLLFL